MKRLASVFLLLVLVTSVASCAAPTPEIVEVEKEVPVEVEVEVTKEVIVEKEVQVEVPAERVNITYWIFGAEGSANAYTGELWSDFYARVIDDYEADHPNVDIDFALRGIEAGGTTTYVDAAVAAGTPPDIYYDVDFRIQKYYQAGLLEPLDPALTPEDRAAYPEDILSANVGPDGDLWALACGIGWCPYAVNKTIFEEAGLEDLLPQPPDYTWTTEEFLEACRAVNDPPDHYCTMFFAKTPSFDTSFNNWFGGFPGCELFDREKQEYVANSPECVKAMEFLHNLLDEGLTVPGPAGFVDDDQDGYWKRKEIAMTGGACWYSGVTTRGLEDGSIEAPMEYMMVNYPHEPGAPPTPLGVNLPHAWSIFKQDDPDKLAAIYDFIHYMQQPEFVSEIAAGWNEVPVRTDAPSPYQDDPEWAWMSSSAQEYGSKNYYYSTGVPCNYNEVRLAWAETRQAFWEPDADVQAVLDEFVEKANGIIAECQ